MAKLTTWLKPIKNYDDPIYFVVSDRFIDEETGKPAVWTLKEVSAAQAERIQEQSFDTVSDPTTKRITKELNAQKYLNGLAAATVVEPDLRDGELQKALGTPGSAVQTLNQMLSFKERNRLNKKISEIYELEEDSLNQKKEDAKNE